VHDVGDATVDDGENVESLEPFVGVGGADQMRTPIVGGNRGQQLLAGAALDEQRCGRVGRDRAARGHIH
jgi:hypothetical protein